MTKTEEAFYLLKSKAHLTQSEWAELPAREVVMRAVRATSATADADRVRNAAWDIWEAGYWA